MTEITLTRNRINWRDFDVFSEEIHKYMPAYGEGDTMASQIATAVNKLVYKWFNDGDVYDNTFALEGWANDLSSYANWLDKYADGDGVMHMIEDAVTEDDYTRVLWHIAETFISAPYLAHMNTRAKVGSIYDCDGDFKFVEVYAEEDW